MEGGIYLLLGSNLGDRLRNLSDAAGRIGSVLKRSSVYKTAAWGNTQQPDFFNQAIEVKSELSPHRLLESLQRIEKDMGRLRIEKWGPRIIDIDILFYKDTIVTSGDLTITHPELQNRRFALEPLAEITNVIHPVLKKTVSQLLRECKDTLAVTRLQPPQPEQSS